MTTTKDTKEFTIDDIQAHKTKESVYLLIHGKVYDVTKFLDEHPGGDEVVLAEAGQDATEAFEDIGHSDEARALLPGFQVGIFKGESANPKSGAAAPGPGASAAAVEQASNLMYFAPLGLLGAYLAWHFFGA